jgi:hypothetical protein
VDNMKKGDYVYTTGGNMKKGDYVKTPRFLTVKIAEIFNTEEEARKEGYREPTHYDGAEYEIVGKHIGTNRMTFAAIKL